MRKLAYRQPSRANSEGINAQCQREHHPTCAASRHSQRQPAAARVGEQQRGIVYEQGTAEGRTNTQLRRGGTAAGLRCMQLRRILMQLCTAPIPSPSTAM